MATLNRLPKIFTHEGAPAARIDSLAQLERSVMSCLLWESEFYEGGQTIGQRIAELVKVIPAEDVARVAIEAKEEMRLRHVPLLLARELMRTKDGRTQAKGLFPRVVLRPDDIAEFLSIYWKDNQDEPLAKQVKRGLGDSFRKFDEYQLAKYNGGQKAVKLRDALRITRPKPADEAQAELWRKLVKGELATPDTWEVELSKGGDKKASWSRLLAENNLGGLAMLRNVRNMTKAGVADEDIRAGIRGVKAGRLLPINFIAAARHNPQFEPELEAKFFECFAEKEKIAGRTIILVDISPSMAARLSARSEQSRMDVGCSLAMIAREMFIDVRIFSFSNQRIEVPTRRGFGLRDAILNSQPSNGTLLGAALKGLPQHDRLIVLTDEQSQDGVPQRKGYLINVASNQNGVGYGQWVHIDGWSDKVLDYIVKYESNVAP
ncbi:TROVE domain-containing protein [Singulisphaera sp. GP187]|uniref:TROVE domain-containing protein n=1 Tax=Singulisphaera sp. GP187 TaxID=1882752 RepID=UPI00092B6A4C|nr:TROVE domain-containing protein [Singulisphaera sp. GP187]SIO16505.1 TROVE domain-containing protein [Singulisphaera sp. GP187]